MDKKEYKLMFRSEEVLWWYRGLREILLWSLKKYSMKNPKILDAGCGTGKNIEFLREKGYQVVGFDASDAAIKYCKKRGIRVKKGSITNVPYLKSTFDVVLCTDVLGSLQNDRQLQKTISELYRVLKPAGILIIQCAAFEWLRSQHDVVIHFHKRFTKQELLSYFERKKWQIKKASYRIFFLFLPLVFVKLFKKLFKQEGESKSDQIIPPMLVNNILMHIQSAENKLFEQINLPVGTSLFLVVRKKGS